MKKIKKAVTAVGVFLVDLMKLDQPGKGRQRLAQELRALSLEGRSAVRNYYVRKVSILLTVLAAGAVLSLVCLAVNSGNGGDNATQLLERPGYGEGDRKESLTVRVDGQQEQELEVTVRERQYTDQERQELLDRALRELDERLPGENDSLDEVRADLDLPQSMEDGVVRIVWTTVPYGIIGEDGTLKRSTDVDGALVEIQGTLTCGKKEAVYTAYAKVFPPELPEQERLLQSIRREVELADAAGSYGETLRLPDTAEGKTLAWYRPTEHPAAAVLLLTLLAAAVICLEMDSLVHQKAERRKNELMISYPDLMWKLTMLLGAGLSIKGAFSRISEEYLREKTGKRPDRRSARKRGKSGVRYAYEEVTYACYEMESGVPEAQAYERFGRRCQLPEYIKLGSVLAQNLKKGSKGLPALLEAEAETSLNERKNHARKIGEQAGTRLLLPMVLMLGIVLAILMVPAFLSF